MMSKSSKKRGITNTGQKSKPFSGASRDMTGADKGICAPVPVGLPQSDDVALASQEQAAQKAFQQTIHLAGGEQAKLATEQGDDLHQVDFNLQCQSVQARSRDFSDAFRQSRLRLEEKRITRNMSERSIRFVGGEEGETATVVAERVDGLCQITFNYRGQSIQATARDYFEAFCHIRLRLEKESLTPFCYGASLSVYPTEALRENVGGLAAYIRRAGKQSTIDDLVFIFDEGPDVIPASVAQQKEYSDKC